MGYKEGLVRNEDAEIFFFSPPLISYNGSRSVRTVASRTRAVAGSGGSPREDRSPWSRAWFQVPPPALFRTLNRALGWSPAPRIRPPQGGASGSRWANSPASPLHALSDPGMTDSRWVQRAAPKSGLRQGAVGGEAPGPIALQAGGGGASLPAPGGRNQPSSGQMRAGEGAVPRLGSSQ